MINIIDGKLYLNQVKELIQEYTQWLKCDLSFQNLDKKLADIAEKYIAPNGELMVLDTIKLLQAAIHLYKKHGFVEREPYYYNPMNDVIYMRKELTE